MNLLEASSPRPSPPQVCGGEGEEGAGGSWAQGAISVRGDLCPPRRARSARPTIQHLRITGCRNNRRNNRRHNPFDKPLGFRARSP